MKQKRNRPRTVTRAQLQNLPMVAGNERRITCVLMPKVTMHRHRWVGIGWVDEGPASDADLKKYPTVIDE